MPRPRSDIAPRILHAARARFLLEGVDGASLRQIAADAGTSIGMVYYYYPTKDELFLAVVEEIYAGLLHDMEEALGHEASAEERLRRLFARVAAMSDDEFTVVRLVVREALISSARLGRLVERFSKGHIPLVLKALIEGVGAGEITDQHHPIVLVASAASIAVIPQIVRRLLGANVPAGVPVPSADALASELVTVLMRGIGPQASKVAHATGEREIGPDFQRKGAKAQRRKKA